MLANNEKKNFYESFVGSLTKNGNKIAAKRMLREALESVKKKSEALFTLRKKKLGGSSVFKSSKKNIMTIQHKLPVKEEPSLKDLNSKVTLKQDDKNKKGSKLPFKKVLGKAYSYSLIDAVSRNLRNSFEAKPTVRGYKRKKTTTYIPFPLRRARQKYLKIKWIIDAAKENKQKVSFKEKLSTELFSLVYDKVKSKAWNTKYASESLAIQNKANAHYRW